MNKQLHHGLTSCYVTLYWSVDPRGWGSLLQIVENTAGFGRVRAEERHRWSSKPQEFLELPTITWGAAAPWLLCSQQWQSRDDDRSCPLLLEHLIIKLHCSLRCTPADPESVGLGWGMGNWISNKHPLVIMLLSGLCNLIWKLLPWALFLLSICSTKLICTSFIHIDIKQIRLSRELIHKANLHCSEVVNIPLRFSGSYFLTFIYLFI